MSRDIQKPGGGFKFDDDEQPQKKRAKFEFTVQEVSEEDAAREKKRSSKKVPAEPAPVDAGADPGRFEWQMVGIVILLLPLVYWLQFWTRGLHGETLSDAPPEVRADETVRDPGVDSVTVQSKLAVKLMFIAEEFGEREPNKTLAQLQEEFRKSRTDTWRRGAEPPLPPPPQAEDEDPIGVAEIEPNAWTRVERLRVAIVAGELDGAPAALQRLEQLKAEVTPGGELATDIHWLEQIYREGPDKIPYEAGDALRARHGWFGRLAMSFAKLPSDSERWDVASGGLRIALSQGVVIAGQVLLSVAGLILGVALLVKYRRSGYLVRYIAPEPGGSVYLETFGVFLGGFALLLLADLFFFGLQVEGSTLATAVNEVLTWTLVGTIAYPLLRGVRWGELMQSLGWHKGEGIRKEIFAGLIGYIGAQPIVWIGMWIGNAVEKATGTAETEQAAGYGMYDLPTEGTGLLFWLGILTAVVWAPVVEESIFRGALMRHVSGRLGLLWSVGISALLFGLIHPYTPAGLIQVASGGIAFGLMRCWRGSLIAPVTAHALHNAVVSALPVTLIAMLG